MIKTVLLILLGLFFLLNGINHLINIKIYEEYSIKKGLISPLLMVRVSSVFLMFGGLTLIFGYLMIYGIIGLSIFLVIASLTMHQFWKEEKTDMRLMEVMHFTKNLAILTELIYIAYS